MMPDMLASGAGSASPKPMADQVRELLLQVGQRVRAARRENKLSRRELSVLSGVSPRYLAQIEAGEGNISIGLLKRVSLALDRRMDSFVAEAELAGAEAQLLCALFRDSEPDTQKRVLDLLDPARWRGGKAGRICLVGLRGAGKSTLGARLGRALDIPFVELNAEIEGRAGMPVGEIIALYGQDGYRQLEAGALNDIVAARERLVLAVAGGIVSEPDTYSVLLGRFHSIWVRASAEEHMARVRAQGDTRPMAGHPEAMAQLRAILRSREAQYEKAEIQIDTSGRSVEASLAQLVDLVTARRILD